MGKKLLVADDSVTIQKVIKLALSAEGYDILAVSEGKEAIRAIQEERPDVVLIDVALPGADAYEVKRATNQNPKTASVSYILMASAFERVDEKAADEVKFQGRLIKPFDPSHLRKAVSELLSKGPSTTSASPSLPTSAPAPLPPAPTPSEPGDDLPPMKDMMPTISEGTSEVVQEEDFRLEATQRIEYPAPPAPPAATVQPPPPPPEDDEEHAEAAATATLENDIKDLTESTIKMSGLDEFQWNLDDTKKMKGTAPAATVTPAAPPAPSTEKTGEMTKPIIADRKVSPLKAIVAPGRPVDDGGTNFPLITSKSGEKEPKVTVPSIKPPPNSNLVSGRDYVAPTVELKREPTNPGFTAPQAPMPMTRAEMEALIRKELEQAFEKLARDVVPQVAESVIRKEIEKILAEP
jgi:CheY-like chemotaxis protein